MNHRLKMNALQQALHANNTSYGEAIPPRLLQDIFADWTHGRVSDEEMVAALLPLKGQPALLRLQILAQAANLGQLLVREADECMIREEDATAQLLEALEEMAQTEGSSPALEEGQKALALHLKALQTLAEGAETGDPADFLLCLEQGEQAASHLFKAQKLAPQHDQEDAEPG